MIVEQFFAELVHSGQNNIILDHRTVSAERYVLIPMVMSFWQASIFLVSKRI